MTPNEKWYSPGPVLRDLRQAHKKGKHLVILVVSSFVILTGATIYTYDTFGEDGGCKLADVPQSNPMQKHFYDPLMRLRFPESQAQQVSMVLIKEGREPLSVITNTCRSREFLSALIQQLVKLNAQVIAVDQHFSDGACLEDSTNDRFRDAFEMTGGVPIVVGWGTHKRPDAKDDGDTCLTLNVPFNFNRSSSGAAVAAKENVSLGLIRLNVNNLKIPLRWWVLPNDQVKPAAEDAAEPHESFSLVAAKLKNSRLAWDKTLSLDLVNDDHPYSSFVRDLPKWSAMDVLCYGPDKIARSRTDWGDCEKVDHHSLDDLKGQVVVVGSEIASESKPFLGGQMFGAELHANYIEALLDGRYVKTVDSRLDRGIVIVFVMAMLFFQFLAVRELPHYKWLSDPVAILLSSILFIVLMIGAFFALEAGWFLPIFFASCFPIATSLLILFLYQLHAVPTKRYKDAQKGNTE